ncbi:hypothetical protein KSS87_002909, partial [Heliosperma pusillum]
RLPDALNYQYSTRYLTLLPYLLTYPAPSVFSAPSPSLSRCMFTIRLRQQFVCQGNELKRPNALTHLNRYSA